jgi:hypothetical protein
MVDDHDSIGRGVYVQLDTIRPRGEGEAEARQRIFAFEPGHATVSDA